MKKVFLLIIALFFCSTAFAEWVSVDASGNVIISSELYDAKVLASNGVVQFFDKDANFLLQLDANVNTKEFLKQKSSINPNILLDADDNIAVVLVSQNSEEAGFNTALTFYRSLDYVKFNQKIIFNKQIALLQEKIIIDDNSELIVYDDEKKDWGTAWQGLTWIGAGQRLKKVFRVNALSTAPERSKARLNFLGRWYAADAGDYEFNSTLKVYVNGEQNAYDISGAVGALPEETVGWVEVDINSTDLVAGADNNIVFDITNQAGNEYFFLAIDANTDFNKSASSSDDGISWNYNDLHPYGSAQDDGEYIVRLYHDKSLDLNSISYWNTESESYTTAKPANLKFSARIMRTNFLNSEIKAIIYGADYFGAKNTEDFNVEALDTYINAFLFKSENNKWKWYVDSNSGTRYAVPQTIYHEFRYAGDIDEVEIVINFVKANPVTTLTKARFPRNYKAALTIVDDTDGGISDRLEAVYYGTSNRNSEDYGKKGFVGHNLKITPTVWWQTGSQGVKDKDSNYQERALDLQNRGFEIALHTISSGADTRSDVSEAFNEIDGNNLFNINHWVDHQCNYTNPDTTILDGAYDGNAEYYNIDLMENANIKYLNPCALWERGADKFNAYNDAYQMPRKSSLVDYRGNSAKIWIYGRSSSGALDGATDSLFAYLTNANIQTLINQKGLAILIQHFRLAGFPENMAAVQNGNQLDINATLEEKLQILENHQNSGNLWVAPANKILEWMIDLQEVQIAEQSIGENDLNAAVKNALQKNLEGLTLCASNNIQSASIRGLYQIYAENKCLVLPAFGAGETKNIQIKKGAYSAALPRITFVDVDLSVLRADYNAESKSINIILDGNGTNKKVMIYIPGEIYSNGWRLYDNGVLSKTSNGTGEVSYVIASTSEHNLIITAIPQIQRGSIGSKVKIISDSR